MGLGRQHLRTTGRQQHGSHRSSPVQVSGLTGVTAVSCGKSHAMALKSDGTVWCWGHNGYGQLGDGTTIERRVPVQVAGLSGVTAIASGYYTSYAVRQDGTLWGWGDNVYGQLGDGTTTDSSTPVQVAGLTGVTAVAAGYGHVVVARSDGTVWAMGSTTMANWAMVPTRPAPLPSKPSASRGSRRSAPATTTASHSRMTERPGHGANNGEGQLGTGSSTDRGRRSRSPGLASVDSLAAGAHQSAAILDDGSLWVFGNNDLGQLGDGTRTEQGRPSR